MTLSLQLLWNYWSIYHETWYVDRTSNGVMHIGRTFLSSHFCGSYAPWNLENIRKSTNNISFLCQFFINEITASDAGPDIIRSHLLLYSFQILYNNTSHQEEEAYRFWDHTLLSVNIFVCNNFCLNNNSILILSCGIYFHKVCTLTVCFVFKVIF